MKLSEWLDQVDLSASRDIAQSADVRLLVRLVKALLTEREASEEHRAPGHMSAYLNACKATDALITEIESEI
jgi:hypothetical protein